MLKPKAQAALLVGVVTCLTLACEGAPAHPKPWRHAEKRPDGPISAAPGSAAASAVTRADAAKRRAHSLRVRLEAEPVHLNPMVDPDVETLRVAEDTIFETLLVRNPDGSLAGRLAESFRTIGGGTEIRVVVRDGVTFHDGHKLSVVDAQFSLDSARGGSGRSPRLREALADVMAVEIVSQRELRLLLRRPNAYVLRTLAEVPILPEHIYRPGELARHPKNKAPIGSGPYRFVRWARGDRITLARNETYWGPAPAVDEVEFVIEPDNARALTRARRGEIDVIPAIAPAHWPAQAEAMAGDFEVVRFHPVRLRYLVVDTTRPPFDDPRVRRALSLLVDRDKLLEPQKGLAVAAPGLVWAGGPGDAPGQPPRSDFSAATALLDVAGWLDTDGNGIRERAGEPLRAVWLVASDGKAELEREVLSSALRKAGFVVETRPGDPAVLMARLKSGDFGMAILEWRGRVDENLAPALARNGQRNFGRYASPAMDAALQAAEATSDPAQKAARVAEIGRLAQEDWPIVPLTTPDPAGLVHRRVRGLVARDGWFAVREVSLAPDEP